jgi:hypothetical protein
MPHKNILIPGKTLTNITDYDKNNNPPAIAEGSIMNPPLTRFGQNLRG